MGLISKEVLIKWNGSNKKWYVSKGYPFTSNNDEFIVNINDLSKGSNCYVSIKCDGENCKGKDSYLVKWGNYLKYSKEDGKYYCKKCSSKLFSSKNITKTKLKNGKSFEQWCIKNNRQDILDRWDYDLNNCKPSEINYGTKKCYYFKCSRGIHKSELKNINRFTNGQEGTMNCKACNSFAQWGKLII